MLVINLLFVVVVSVIIGALFSVGLRGRNDWAGTFWLFLILFFGTWALGGWLRPMGPPAWTVYWVPYVIAGAVIALFFSALTPAQGRSRLRSDRPSQLSDPGATDTEQRARDAVAAVSVFFWLLLAVAVGAIVLQYVMQVTA